MVLSYVFLIDIYLINEDALMNELLIMNRWHKFKGSISFVEYNELLELWLLNY